MASSLFGNSPSPQVPAQMSAPNSPMAMLQQFQQFRQQMAGRDPRQVIQQMLQSGQMSQQQYNGLMQQAQSMLSLFRR